MGSNFSTGTRQSGALVIWLALITCAMSLALFLSWTQRSSTETSHQHGVGQAASANTPVKELKLLASEVVSRGTILAQNSSESLDVSDNIFRKASPFPFNHHSSATLALERRPAAGPDAQEPVPGPFAELIPQATADQLSADLVAESGLDSVMRLADEVAPDTRTRSNPWFVENPSLKPGSRSLPAFDTQVEPAILSDQGWQQIPMQADVELPVMSDAGAGQIAAEFGVQQLPDDSQQLAYLQQDDMFAVRSANRGKGDTSADLFSTNKKVRPDETYDPSSQLDEIRSLMGEVLKIDADSLAENSQLSIRRDALDSLEEKSAKLQFGFGSRSISEQMDGVLTEIFGILIRYEDTLVTVSVETGESGNAEQNLRLSQERGRAIIARGVSQGIDFSRLSLEATQAENNRGVSHTVEISARSASANADQ
ncbi:MAG: OmpA family protein [Granulosicoccus sp.]